MRISIFESEDPKHLGFVWKQLEIDESKFLEIICRRTWSPACFNMERLPMVNGTVRKGRRRRDSNLKSISLLTFDIDQGMTLVEAKETIKKHSLWAIIGTTRSHKKEKTTKGGLTKPPCDRFRIVLKLESELTTDVEYRKVWFAAKGLFPTADDACKDSARLYWPCKKIVFRNDGSCFRSSMSNFSEKAVKAVQMNSPSTVERGVLSVNTRTFLKSGEEKGKWHDALYRASRDFHEQQYPVEEARAALLNITGMLDEHDEDVIRDAYSKPSRYGPRIHQNSTSSSNQSPVFVPKTQEQRLAKLTDDRTLRRLALKNPVPFIGEAFEDVFFLTMGLCIVGACTGNGKSTTAANVLACFFERCEKQALVISNEESSEDIITRVACILLKKSWTLYRKDLLERSELGLVFRLAKNLTKRIEVVSLKKVPGEIDTSKLEDVLAVLEGAKNRHHGYGLIVLDYLQAVTASKVEQSTVKISKMLGDALKNYCAEVPIPVVVFCQLKPTRAEQIDFSERIQNDHTITNHAVVAVEVKRMSEGSSLTSFTIHKDRFGTATGKQVVVEWCYPARCS